MELAAAHEGLQACQPYRGHAGNAVSGERSHAAVYSLLLSHMVKGGGGDWLQPDGKLLNPLLGAARCSIAERRFTVSAAWLASGRKKLGRPNPMSQKPRARGTGMLKAIISFCIRERLIIFAVFTGVAILWLVLDKAHYRSMRFPTWVKNQVIIFGFGRTFTEGRRGSIRIAVRGYAGAGSGKYAWEESLFGYSFIAGPFPDETDFYWARSRVARGNWGLPRPSCRRGRPDARPRCDRAVRSSTRAGTCRR